MSINLSNIEGTHRLLFGAHWELVRAKEKVHAAIVAIHAAGLYAESRNESKEPLAALEKARDAIDLALNAAGDGRSKLIHRTGCDGSCSEGAAQS